jgi:hypothetical protein
MLAQGVNNSKTNPILHGEIVAINDYVARHGWANSILYTTGEPCPMCMSAIVWVGNESAVRARLFAGGNRIRTIGPAKGDRLRCGLVVLCADFSMAEQSTRGDMSPCRKLGRVRGTDGSNPASSSGESANSRSQRDQAI